MKVMIALLMFGVLSGAVAAEWVFFATANNKGTVVDVDKASIVYGPITKVWIRYTFNIATRKNSPGDVVLKLTRFNCATREAQWVESIIHAKFGGDSTEKGNGEWEAVAPDPIYDAILTAVCKPGA
jgi:hypothetical protein